MKKLYLPTVKLRSIQIKGFKSFANDTTIHFNDEIIGIVGPNGSGKSNIVDAIRWVLGEQKSKELRLDKMVDVIFNGTKSKKKAGMAQVSMTFENSRKLIPLEFDNVKVSRILYDTNESEYRINDVPCRLKDIRDLFLDTGIGSNSYSIIELGMVDDILADKDNARRKMFEQGAGIAKYKTRKRETFLKLKNTQLDLDRIEDILFELQANLKKFEKQAKRTKRYYELKEEYKDLSIKKAVISQKESIHKEADLKTRMVQLQEVYATRSNEVHTLEAEIEQTKKANLDSEQLLSIKQKEFSLLIDDIRKSESQQEITKQNKSFVQQNIARITKNNAEFSNTLNKIKADLATKTDEYSLLSAKSENLETNYLSWKSKYEEVESRRQAVQGENSSELDDLKLLEDSRFNLEKTIIEITSQSQNYDLNSNNTSKEVTQLTAELDELEKDLRVAQTELEQLNEVLSTLQKEKETLTEKNNTTKQEIENDKNSLVKLNRQKDAQSNELNLLEDMLNNLEGFPESSKFLYKEWNSKKPILSDIIDCKDEYRSTIEAYLEPYLNYFILDNIEDARNSIQLLKEAQKGKSKFFILESFNEEPNTQILFDHLGIPALSVIKAEGKYSQLLNFLLSNVVIVENEKILTADFPNEDVIYVSNTGDSNRSKHIITGGSIGLFDGKRIGRKQSVNKLKDSIKELNKQIAELESQIESNEKNLKESSTLEIENDLNSKTILKNQIDIKVAQFLTKVNAAKASLAQLDSKILEYRAFTESNANKVLTFRSELEGLLATINNKKEVISSQSGLIEEIARDFGETSGHYNAAQLSWVQHQNDTNTLSKDVAYYENQVIELESKINKSSQELIDLNAKSEVDLEKLEALKVDLIKKYEVRDEQQKELGQTEQAFFSKRSVITDKEDRLKKLNKGIQESQLNINNLKDELTGIEFDLRSSMDRLMIEFNIDIKTIATDEVLENIDDPEALMISFEKIKKRLDNYGEINPMAVEAYDEILGRWESMETQKNDIIEAKKSLLETIKEIDNDATEKFLAAFYKVRENFKEVFRSLFSSEDDCDLILFNPDDPLNSGIEIIAKPKGKRPKVLSQLSGGEKTLTATALLFSLYLLKPAPFCIFDEVDAPLDDLNIQKFSRLIRRFADASQFIIITHNKSTMANMDLLYGVYMQEQGVSGITQVDFREYEHSEVFQTVNLN